MTQKGEHTWDMVIDYKACPKCGFINENREEFQNKAGSWEKNIICGRCGDAFIVREKRKKTFGPLIGTPQPPEITWE